MGYDVGGALCVEILVLKIRHVTTGFILPSKISTLTPLQHSRKFISGSKEVLRSPNDQGGIDRPKVSTVE